jgi:iron complex outermembrane receptor protein
LTYPTGEEANDDWGMVRGGFRIDSSLTPKDSLSVHGDIYTGTINQQMDLASYTWSPSAGFSTFVHDKTDASGRNMVALWEHVLASDSKFTLQAYYDKNDRDGAFIKEAQDNFDLEFQHLFTAWERHNIVWGGRYRSSKDDFSSADLPWVLTIDPESRRDDLFSVFLQDEIMIARDALWLTLGSKLEHNDYSGYEVEPSARLLWAVRNNQKLWTSISRAVRMPSRIEHDGNVLNGIIPSPDSFNPASPLFNPSNPLPIEFRMVGNPEFEAEKLTAYELGYRFLYSRDLSLDTAIFYNDYDKLRLLQKQDLIFNGATMVQNYLIENAIAADSYGIELALAWQATNRLKLDLAYSYLDSNMNAGKQVGDEPHHQASLRGFVNLRDDLDLNIWLRYVDNVTAFYFKSAEDWYEIDRYVALDLRLAWRPMAKIELALVGQNLLSSGSVEFVQENLTRPTEIARSVYGKLTYKF